MPKFKLTGRDPNGMKVVVETENRYAATDLMAFWKEAGFAEVKMIWPDVRGDRDTFVPHGAVWEAGIQ